MENYSPRDIEEIIETISWNPQGFRRLAAKFSSVTDAELVRSMYAWGIDPWATSDGYSGDRTPRKRKNYRDSDRA